MQKIFIKYTVLILTSAIFLILFINFLFDWHSLESQQFNTFQIKIEQIIHTLENNQTELEIMKENLDEDYLTRAKAAAYVLDRQDEKIMDVSEMQYLAKLLNVDELHYIDENGIIVSASVSKYIGMDMANDEQTRPFLDLLKSDGEDYLIQEARPNAAEGKIMQYIGVAEKIKEGFIQVGFEPKRQMEAQARNTYDYIFSRFPTDEKEEFFVVDYSTGEILGHSENIEKDFSADCYQVDEILQCKNGAYKNGADGRKMYIVYERYGDALICAALPGAVLTQKLLGNIFRTLIYLLFIETAVIMLLNYLVRWKVVDGIHGIIDKLSCITNGSLDTVVEVGGNREFEELSSGINTMVKSIISISNRTSAIIKMSGIPLAAYEYEDGVGTVFATSELGKVLGISEERVTALCKSPKQFDEFICRIIKRPVEEEEDVYQVHSGKYVRIHMSASTEGKLGVITDVTGDVMEKERMRYENTHDPLTQLYKYQYFQFLAADTLHHMQKGKICALVMMDLDYFKGINDSFGHDAGDRYLQKFAEVMHGMPSEHVLSARRSGDEFCMMIYDCGDKNAILRYLDDFYEMLEKNPVKLSESREKIISASAGFVCTEDAQADIQALMGLADEALYEVKEGKKGTYGDHITK